MLAGECPAAFYEKWTAPALCSFPIEKNNPPPRLADGSRRADRTAMNRFRKEVLFFCDAVIFAAAVAFFLLVYTVFDYAEVGPQSGLLRHVVLLYACTVFFQLLFKTYDSLWRYAESQEYLSLLAAALCGFAAYEVIARVSSMGAMSFVLLLGIACAWVLGMLTVRFLYRGYRTRILRRDRSSLVPVAILGAGEAGAARFGASAESRQPLPGRVLL